MLAVQHHLAAPRPRRLDAVGDAVKIFVQRNAQRRPDLIVRGLGHKHNRVGVSVEQLRHARIIGGGAPGPLGHAEGGEAGLHFWFLREEKRVDGVGARIAALNIIYAQRVQHRRDGALVVEREIHAGGLRAVAQRGVEQGQALAGHGSLSGWPNSLVIVVLPIQVSPSGTVLRRSAI